MKFEKAALTTGQLVAGLVDRQMDVGDPAWASRILDSINYYRLATAVTAQSPQRYPQGLLRGSSAFLDICLTPSGQNVGGLTQFVPKERIAKFFPQGNGPGIWLSRKHRDYF